VVEGEGSKLFRQVLRRIEQETGVLRETASAYVKAAGIAVRRCRAWGRRPAKPAIEVTTGTKPESAAVNRNINPENLPKGLVSVLRSCETVA
jgi:hypothetical protein